MKLQINAGDVDISDAIHAHIEKQVDNALRKFNGQVTRVEVHLRDHNGKHKHGADMECTMEVRLAGHQPHAVHAEAEDLYDAISAAAHKLERSTRRKLERHEAHQSKAG